MFVRWLPILGRIIAVTVLIGALSSPAGGETSHRRLVLVDRAPFAEGTDLAFSDDLIVAGSTASAPAGGIHVLKKGRRGRLAHLSFGSCAGFDSDVGIYKHLALQSIDSPSSNRGCRDEGKEGLRIWDIRNPRRPKPVGFAETLHGSHTFTVLGRSGFAYVSSYNLTSPHAPDGVSIVDLRKGGRNPSVDFLEFPDADAGSQYKHMRNESGTIPNSPGCHDIGINMKLKLAFCAAITETHVWDISDPADPVIISIIRNPAINVHHSAIANSEGNVLIIGDEFAGATSGAACAAPNNPNGAVWFYDVSDPTDPQPLSWWAPPDVNPTVRQCTSHVFDTASGEDLVVAGWFTAGLFVIDFSEPTRPEMIARYQADGASFWSAYFEDGYIYANSYSNQQTGGIYVMKLTLSR